VTANPLSPAPIEGGLPTQYIDTDPAETREWLESLDAVIDAAGPYRARVLMLELLRRARERAVGVPSLKSTDYINTIHTENEPWFPGDEAVEARIRQMIRWNAAMMVHRAQRPGIGVGGHISSYASSAHLYEVGFNHFFRGLDHPGGGDQVFIQGHSAPGVYARAFLEGRLGTDQLDGFRQEVSHPAGSLPSYPHPRLMPDFWQFPTVSMGLGPLNAIYQARFNRYLHNRGIKDTSQQHVWAFLGDGEMDEPESRGALQLAAYEELDNLTFVVNCNLQRLDGPVRGNGKIIQELESFFRGAGWNVIKVIWGRKWDQLFAMDSDGALVNLMNTTPDGSFQTYRAEGGGFIKEHFFGRDPRTARMVEHWSDDEVWSLRRGGHDYRKVYAAYSAAMSHTGQPTVILAKTVKGYALESFEGRNATHQMKKLTLPDLKLFRDRTAVPISDAQLEADPYLPPYYHPGEHDDAIRYMAERRAALGGSLPRRRGASSTPLPPPQDRAFEALKRGSGKQLVATTMATVRLFKDLMRDPELGRRFVPIIPDEARTFGLDAVFPTAKIYNPHGHNYISVDRDLLLAYKEATAGQILHEGINEAGSVGSFIAAGTSYSTHDEPMIPFYIFYSMFGFQRTGDSFWAAMDQMTRGFLLGATAGRTTLSGEGLQHNDGQSLLYASANPACVAYDPAYAYEIGHIVKDGMRRMFGAQPENVFYYLTIYNEPILQPAEPAGVDVEGILRGMHLVSPAADPHAPLRAQLLSSGSILPETIRAQQLLREQWNVHADVWSVTSWTELRRDGLECDRYNFLHPDEPARVPFVTQRLQGRPGPVIAVSDWVRATQDGLRNWMPGEFTSLGTDGYGISDTRGAARRHFLVDAESTAAATLGMLARSGQFDPATAMRAIDGYQLHDPTAADPGNTEGSA
jgi:pyruvate dehydrogenase E1 component